jgi:hypothetical protein
MGLAEKRLAKDIQDTVLPVYLKEVEDNAGFAIPITVQWDTFTAFDEYPLTRLRDSALPDILGAIAHIGKDELGREGLKAVLKEIRLENTADDDAVDLSLTDGVLHHRMRLAGDTYRSYSAGDIAGLLESRM